MYHSVVSMSHTRAKTYSTDLPSFSSILESKISIKNSPMYKKFIKDKGLVIEDGNILTMTNSMQKMHNELQLNSAYNKEKNDTLINLLSEIEGERAVIFYRYDSCLKQLMKICKDRPISHINGEGKDLDNYVKYDNAVALCQWKSAAVGADGLQLGHHTFSYSLTNEYELFDQHYWRTNRIGRDVDVTPTYTFLLSPLESKMYDVLKEGKDFTTELYEVFDNERKI